VTTAASGKGTVLADRATGRVLISYITHTVASANAADIHSNARLVRVVDFSNLQTNVDGAGTNLANPLAGAQMTAEDLADFDASQLYFNVASPVNPRGEVRGNIAPQ
jgi:hypothetical protein